MAKIGLSGVASLIGVVAIVVAPIALLAEEPRVEGRTGWSSEVREHGQGWVFMDGFESGGTASWSSVVP